MKKIRAYVRDNALILAIAAAVLVSGAVSLVDPWVAAFGAAVLATSPAFASTPNKGTPVSITNADTETDGTGADTVLVFTAGANGSFLPGLRCKPLGTNVSSLLRVFRNNGSTPATASNNALIEEKNLPAVTISQTAENAKVDVPLNLSLAASERIYVCIATAVSGGWKVSPINGGDF